MWSKVFSGYSYDLIGLIHCRVYMDIEVKIIFHDKYMWLLIIKFAFDTHRDTFSGCNFSCHIFDHSTNVSMLSCNLAAASGQRICLNTLVSSAKRYKKLFLSMKSVISFIWITKRSGPRNTVLWYSAGDRCLRCSVVYDYTMDLQGGFNPPVKVTQYSIFSLL